MFYKHLISTGFHTDYFKMFLNFFSIKCFDSILSQMFLYPYFQIAYLIFYLQIFASKDGGEQ